MFICPLTKVACVEDKCAWWVILLNDKKEEIGRCSIAWHSILLIELKTVVGGAGKP